MRLRSLCSIICIIPVLLVFCIPAHAGNYSNPAVDGPGGSAYWVDLGALYATYGSYSAAIEAYKKALALDPASGPAHYNIALSYAEVGETGLALEHINTAISLSPNDDRYYYARGRINLLSGNSGKAMEDFKKAAGLGNPDAVAYLKTS
jgi:tetratricopeptide (TPR) repeat protein